MDHLGHSKPLVPPLYQSSVYCLEDLDALDRIMNGDEPGFIYARDNHPNAVRLAGRLAEMEAAAGRSSAAPAWRPSALPCSLWSSRATVLSPATGSMAERRSSSCRNSLASASPSPWPIRRTSMRSTKLCE